MMLYRFAAETHLNRGLYLSKPPPFVSRAYRAANFRFSALYAPWRGRELFQGDRRLCSGGVMFYRGCKIPRRIRPALSGEASRSSAASPLRL